MAPGMSLYSVNAILILSTVRWPCVATTLSFGFSVQLAPPFLALGLTVHELTKTVVHRRMAQDYSQK